MTNCLQTLREEFRLKKFGFGDVYPRRFHMWQWRVPPLVYLLYRFIMAAYVDVWMIILFVGATGFNGFPGAEHVSWAAFLTNWTYAVLALYLTAHFIASSVHYLCFKCHGSQFHDVFSRPSFEGHQNMFPETYSEPWGSQNGGYEPVPDVDMEMEYRMHKLPWYLIIVWILFNVVSSAALMVTLVFFVFLFPQMSGADAGGNENVQLHMLNSVIIVIEHLVSGIPIRLLHVIYPILYGLVYMLFSIFYWIPDHKHTMYPNVLDWNQPGPTVGMIFLVGFVIIPLIHLLFFVTYRVKLSIYRISGC